MADTMADLVNLAFAPCRRFPDDRAVRFDHGIAMGWLSALRMARDDVGRIVTTLVNERGQDEFVCQAVP